MQDYLAFKDGEGCYQTANGVGKKLGIVFFDNDTHCSYH